MENSRREPALTQARPQAKELMQAAV